MHNRKGADWEPDVRIRAVFEKTANMETVCGPFKTGRPFSAQVNGSGGNGRIWSRRLNLPVLENPCLPKQTFVLAVRKVVTWSCSQSTTKRRLQNSRNLFGTPENVWSETEPGQKSSCASRIGFICLWTKRKSKRFLDLGQISLGSKFPKAVEQKTNHLLIFAPS